MSGIRRVFQAPALLAALALGLLFAPAALAQEAAPEPAAPPAEDAALLASEEGQYETIEELLAQDEEVLSDPDSYSYDPGTRRDPFRSLLVTRTPVERQEERPDGPAGLLIDELEIEGVFFLADGPVVQVQSASQETSFLLRPGDQLWDGELVRITEEEVVFKQHLDDPTALKPFREVVKRLNP